jgi:hypothetical protein
VNPKRTGENNEMIAVIFDMMRIPPDFPLDWIADPAGARAVGASAASAEQATP